MMNTSKRLSIGTQWRAAGLALTIVCGGSSAAQSLLFSPAPGGVALPDGVGVGYANMQTITTLPTAVQELRVRLTVEGGVGGMINGDLYATLSYQVSAGAPITAYAVLLNRPGRDAGVGDADGYFDNGLNISLGATGPDVHTYQLQTVPGVGSPLTGRWAADGRDADPNDVVVGTPRTAGLDAFQGLNPNGVWTLYVEDTMPGGVARLTGWGLEWTPVAVPEPQALGCVVGILLMGSALCLRRRWAQASRGTAGDASDAAAGRG